MSYKKCDYDMSICTWGLKHKDVYEEIKVKSWRKS